MRLHSSPGGVKVSTLPGLSDLSGYFPESGLRFLFIFVVFTFVHRLLSACTLKRGAPSTASYLTHS